MQININGYNINYESVGEGRAVLMLHGWGSSLDAYKLLTAAFCDKFRMISLDFPGFGGSDMPKEAWEVDQFADITLKFIDMLGLKNPIMIGHSFGGRVIIKLAGSGMVTPEKIILIDSAGIKPKRSIRSKIRLAVFKTGKWFLTLPLLKKYTASALDKLRAYFGSSDYNSAPSVMRQTLVRVINEDLRGYMPSIKAPTLLIWGENDTATPLGDAKIMEQLIPDSGLCVIKGTGHFSFVQRPYEVHAIIASFLGGN